MCCDAESIPCRGCESAGFADNLLAAIGSEPLDEAPAVEPDPIALLPWPRPARKPFLQAVPKPLPRPVIAPGRYGLADLIVAQSEAYGSSGNAVAELIAETLRDLADRIKATGATSVASYRDRAEALDAMRADEMRASYYDRGYTDALESAAYATA